MKKLLFIFSLLALNAFSFAHPGVNEKIIKYFEETFPFARQASWSDYGTYYQVYFQHDSIICRIEFNLEGNIISVRRDYLEKDMPLFLLAKIKRAFKNRKVFGITEITSNAGLIYDVVMEDAHSWLVVRSDVTGFCRVTKRYKKSGS